MNFQDKGWIFYRDKPLIQHAIDIANSQVDNIVISYNQNEARYAGLAYTMSTDIEPGYAGPLMGILSCKKLISAGLVFVLPCDMPDLPPDIVNQLYSKLGSHKLAVAHDGNRLQPLVFLAKTQLIDSIQHYLGMGNRSVKGWVESVDYVVVDFASQRAAFWNLNEPSQLQE